MRSGFIMGVLMMFALIILGGVKDKERMSGYEIKCRNFRSGKKESTFRLQTCLVSHSGKTISHFSRLIK